MVSVCLFLTLIKKILTWYLHRAFHPPTLSPSTRTGQHASTARSKVATPSLFRIWCCTLFRSTHTYKIIVRSSGVCNTSSNLTCVCIHLLCRYGVYLRPSPTRSTKWTVGTAIIIRHFLEQHKELFRSMILIVLDSNASARSYWSYWSYLLRFTASARSYWSYLIIFDSNASARSYWSYLLLFKVNASW